MKTTHNTQKKLVLNFNYFLYILGLFLICLLFSCSHSKCCKGVTSKKPINKFQVHKANFTKKRYNL